MKNEQIGIAVVEDDAPIRNLISTTLHTNGYYCETAVDGNGALKCATSGKIKMMLLDLGLPDIDGVEVIKQIRTFSMMPIIIISARSDDEDKIKALDAGADDYLTKPFSVEELLARVRSTIRRLEYAEAHHEEESPVFENGNLKIDYTSAAVYVNGQEIHLMPIEYHLLCLFSKNVGKILTHTYILNKVWTNALESDLSSLRVYMTSLRKKIEKYDKQPYIQTHIGIGYRMVRLKKGEEK
ncbi:response regulator transcription factor [Erysipelotrichaceae bacterium HCN-30851]